MQKPNITLNDGDSLKTSELSEDSKMSTSQNTHSKDSEVEGFHFLDNAYEAKDNLVHIDNHKFNKKINGLKLSFVGLSLILFGFVASQFHNISVQAPILNEKYNEANKMLSTHELENPFLQLAKENNADFSLFSVEYSRFIAHKNFFSKVQSSSTTNDRYDAISLKNELEKLSKTESSIFELLHEDKKYQKQLDFYFAQMKNEKNPFNIRQQFFYEFVFLVKAHQQFHNENFQLSLVNASYTKFKELEYSYFSLVEHNVITQLTLSAIIVTYIR